MTCRVLSQVIPYQLQGLDSEELFQELNTPRGSVTAALKARRADTSSLLLLVFTETAATHDDDSRFEEEDSNNNTAKTEMTEGK
jgi:hypothetical protein